MCAEDLRALPYIIERNNLTTGLSNQQVAWLRVKSNISGREPYFHIYQFRPISEGEGCVESTLWMEVLDLDIFRQTTCWCITETKLDH